MALASVPTHSERVLGHPSRWPDRVRRRSQAAALLGALALPTTALAQLPAAEPRDGAAPTPAAALPAVAPPSAASSTPPTVPPASAASLPTISRLPAGMSVRAQGSVLKLLVSSAASGQSVVVTQLPLLGAKFETLCIGGVLFVARGAAEVVVLDVRNPLQPRQVASFLPGGEVVALWGGRGSLILGRSDGATLLFDISDPTQPRYQSLISAGTAPIAEPETPRRPAPPDDQSRLAVGLRPFLFFANRRLAPTSGGTMLDFSYQYTKVGGLWWGIEIAPLVINSYFDGLPSVNSRVWFGYSDQYFAVAAAMGSGLNNNSAYLQFGPVLRFGRLDGVHSMLRLLWSVANAFPYPVSGEFNLEGPINQRLGLRYNFTGDSALFGFHTTLGLQVFVGGDRRWRTTVLTTGVGFAYMSTGSNQGSSSAVHHPGLIFNFIVEPRW